MTHCKTEGLIASSQVRISHFNTKQYVSIALLDPCCRYQDR